MVPVTLTLHAFGPFAGEQEIPFSGLKGRRIFLITGETGAGKTTIFDAVSFALYGNASGENRKPNTLKSHHAGENDLCWVRFTFRLRDAEYTVYRQPQQTAFKRDGTLKDISEKAELTLPDRSVITGAAAVTKQIAGILGLSYVQFKQTIMLAQGEFRRLLEASSRDKQEIFSKIFGTDAFRFITDCLSERQSALYRATQAGQQAVERCVAELGELGYKALLDKDAQFLTRDSVTALVEQSLALHRDRLDQLDADISRTEKELSVINLEEAAQRNQKITRFQSLKTTLEGLRVRDTTIEAEKRKLNQLRRARELTGREESILSTKKAMKAASARLSQLEAADKQSRTGLETAQHAYNELPGMESRMDALNKQLVQLDSRMEAAALARRRQDALAKRRKDLLAGQKRLKRAEAAEAYLNLQKETEHFSLSLAVLKKLHALDSDYSKTAREHASAKDRYQCLYREFLGGQAAILAKDLREGAPCPVCGATHHPLPAEASRDVPGEAMVDAALKELDKLSSRLVACERDIAAKRAELVKLHPDLTDRLDSGDLEQLAARWQLRLDSLTADCDSLWSENEGFPEGLDPERIAASIREMGATVAAEGEAVRTLESELEGAEALPAPEALSREKKTISQEADALASEIRRRQKAYLDARSAADKVTAELGATKQHCHELSVQFSASKEEFMERLRLAGFDGAADFDRIKPELTQIDALAKSIEDHSLALSATQAQLEALAADVEGRQPVDLDSLTLSHRQLTATLKALREEKTELFALVSATNGRMKELDRLWSENEVLGRQYIIANELAGLAKGSRGSGVSFERYILASYFEDIIQIANIHLQRMTGSRYRLKRKEEKSRAGSSGLDMEVIDSYTGTERSVSTLSGGEGFKASLALALGLSDVVQFYAGGISIDTMFIDEGFGSLDEKSLDSAVETLLSLETGGRMVGIISHVPQLRNAIPTKLVVRYSPTGSSAAFEGPDSMDL